MDRRVVLLPFCISFALLAGCHRDGSGGAGEGAIAAPRGLFPFPTRIELGIANATGMASGDLDGDGDTDLALALFTAGLGPDVMLVHLDRIGNVVDQEVLDGARSAYDIAAVDLDGDGRLDLALLDRIGEMLVYMQESDGSFAVPVPYALGDGPEAFASGDFDGDGELDFLVANGSGADVATLLGRGDGTFEPARFSPGVGGTLVSVGHLDQDGILDLAVATFSSLFVQMGLGGGQFGAPQLIESGSLSFRGLALADVTGDGLTDLVRSAVNDRRLRIFAGDGDGTFTPGYEFFVGNPSLDELAITDLNVDGTPDIVLASSVGFHPLIGQGGGDFDVKPVHAPGGGFLGAFLARDRDADGIPDLLAIQVQTDGFSDPFAALVFLDGRGNGTFDGPCVYPAGEDVDAMVLADLVQDGVTDVAVVSEFPRELRVLPGAADGSFGAPLTTPLSDSMARLTAIDFDANTLDDLVLHRDGFGPATMDLLSSLGNGFFAAASTIPAGGVSTRDAAVADLDGDFLPDLVLANANSNQISVHLGALGGGFAEPRRFGTGFGPSSVELADLDGDLVIDAVVANTSDNSISVLLGLGDGTFAPDTAFATGLEGPSEVALGDIDRDGELDVAVACSGGFPGGENAGLAWMPGDGTGAFGLPVVVDSRFSFRVRLVDLNGDARLDLVRSAFDGIEIALGQGNGFGPLQSYFTGSFVSEIAVHDVNQDEKPDLLLAQGGSESQLLVFLNQGPSLP